MLASSPLLLPRLLDRLIARRAEQLYNRLGLPTHFFGIEDRLMCGIAGVVDLTGRHPVPDGALHAMAEAMVHRGPDEDGFFDSSAVGMVSRRLSIIGLRDGRQPISNEDGSVAAVFN